MEFAGTMKVESVWYKGKHDKHNNNIDMATQSEKMSNCLNQDDTVR